MEEVKGSIPFSSTPEPQVVRPGVRPFSGTDDSQGVHIELTDSTRTLRVMTHTNPRHLRFVRTVRRSHLARLAATGALVVIPAACGSNDADVFGAAGQSVTTDQTVTTEAVTTTAALAETTATTVTTVTTAAADDAADAATVPATAEMVVDFTYTAEASGGRAHNPYVAVWVEDTDGNLVRTISLWYEQSDKGARWLNDLSSWYGSSGGDVLTSGATRAAGSYSVVWDGTDLDGGTVAAGQYVVYIESAREHGPHSITAVEVTLGNDGFSVTLRDDGELSSATATFTV